MDDQRLSRLDHLMDLLAEEIARRLESRRQSHFPPHPLPEREPIEPLSPPLEVESELEPGEEEEGRKEIGLAQPPDEEPIGEEPELLPAPVGPSHATKLMARMMVGLLIAVILINIPINRHGTTLATVLPDSAALVIKDGLVVKESSDEKIYVFQNDHFRWISSLDAFEHYGYTWGDVHIVEDGFLDRFEIGPPIHLLLKCPGSPHIYRLENGEKRWIRDIATFEAEGHVWEDVRFVSCNYLRTLPDGETIPPGCGPPPQP